MPEIFDNIASDLASALSTALANSDRGDFCVGYFNLRGWGLIDEQVERLPGGGSHCCRLLIGMQRLPQEDLRNALAFVPEDGGLDNASAARLKKRLINEFREQLTIGAPTNRDEQVLRRLARQIKDKKVFVKLFLRHPLHAKLYLLFRPDPLQPRIGYLGSSNLTQSGLANQGELNIDVTDQDACRKIEKWFEDRWNDRWCVDISNELAEIIDESWARDEPILPYHIYLKIAYHLSEEARSGLTEFQIPREFGNRLLDFQIAAVKIAAHHLNRRGGVIIGDVVGLGKTLMATAVARIFEDDHGCDTLVICPKNLVQMWESYRDQYRLRARVLSMSMAEKRLPELPRHQLVVIDESHNLRNREGVRYRAIKEYIERNDCKCILMSATPYNMAYLDLSNQLRLFVDEDADLGIRPERLIGQIGESAFMQQHQVQMRTLAAFERSEHPSDWRNLMRLYMVRRTRSFIQKNYARTDKKTGRKYLSFDDGTPSYFPARIPRTVQFHPDPQYSALFSSEVVDAINALRLPRYGLKKYISYADIEPGQTEKTIIDDLSRAHRRLVGFCRTNLFKRLESSGYAFLQSIRHHIIRNLIYTHALDAGTPLPIGQINVGAYDSCSADEDTENVSHDLSQEDSPDDPSGLERVTTASITDLKKIAADIYNLCAQAHRKRFRWLDSRFFSPVLKADLQDDTGDLLRLLEELGPWDPGADPKLGALHELLTHTHPRNKILVFSQFADTVRYLQGELESRGVTKMAGATGQTQDPTGLAWRFSPKSNGQAGNFPVTEELRILISTDVLSEGQNLQDCSIVVNYDLPWAIIRLIQRAGRVDRIGQEAQKILCYSFLPEDGIDQLIDLRERVRRRLDENAEVVGTDERFFEFEDPRVVRDLYNEKSGILDDDYDSEVDLTSHAYQIWQNATTEDPNVKAVIEKMPAVCYSTKNPRMAIAPEIEVLENAEDPIATGDWARLHGRAAFSPRGCVRETQNMI